MPTTTLRRRNVARATVALLAFLAMCAVNVAQPSTPRDVATNNEGAGTIDTSSRAAVQNAYTQWWAPIEASDVTWDGSVDPCNPGTVTAANQTKMQSAVNYMRAMAGLDPVTFDPALSAKAQKAALIMHAQERLSHTPPSTWRCWSADGAAAAANSNLQLGTGGPAAVANLMADPGPGNVAAGHRRWILYPPTRTMGSGSTSYAYALTVIGGQTLSAASSGTPVMWPAAGYFPAELEPFGRWTVSIAGADFTNAKVTVTRDGVRLPVTVNTPVPANNDSTFIGDPTLVFEVDHRHQVDGPDRSYDVEVTGIGGVAPSTLRYSTTLFHAGTPSQPTDPTPTTRPTDPTPTVPYRPTQQRPIGSLDAITIDGRRVTMRGWAWDSDLPSGGLATVAGGGGVTTLAPANQSQPWLAAYGIGDRSGVTATFDLPRGGPTDVCLFALDHNGVGYTRSFSVLGCAQVVVK